MKFKYIVESNNYPLGQRLWVMDRSMPIVVFDKNDKELFNGKLEDFLVPKNEKYLKIPSEELPVKDGKMVYKILK